MEEAFSKLKELMKQDLLLSFPDYSQDASKLELYVDASATGAGACLMQLQQGERRVIGYNSIAFSPAQRKYAVVERELAAIRWGVKVFRPFIYGVPFILYTDHRPLIYMRNMARDNARINRTMTELGEYEMEIRYCRGVDNTTADVLSRLRHVHWDDDPSFDSSYLPAGLKLISSVPGGGDSLFTSLLCALDHHRDRYDDTLDIPDTPQDLRNKLVQKLLTSPEHYGMKPTKIVRREFKAMLNPGCFPC